MTTITLPRAVAEQMLEALEYRDGDGADQWKANVITALRAALAEPVQEPLGWAVQIGTHSAGRRQGKPRYAIFFNEADAENLARRTGARSKPFYLGGNDESA